MLRFIVSICIMAGAIMLSGRLNAHSHEPMNNVHDAVLVIENTSLLPVTVYARFQYTHDPENRNYGFIRQIKPGASIRYVVAPETQVYACDGKYWEGFNPKERLMLTGQAGVTYTFSTNEFRP